MTDPTRAAPSGVEPSGIVPQGIKPSRTVCSNEQETEAIAAAAAGELRPGDVVTLQGPLGAGKSIFARGIARALGIADRMPSPTFALALDYPGNPPVLHLDLYRLAHEDEFELLDLYEEIEASVTLVEWPERAPALLERARLRVELAHHEHQDHRVVTLVWRARNPQDNGR